MTVEGPLVFGSFPWDGGCLAGTLVQPPPRPGVARWEQLWGVPGWGRQVGLVKSAEGGCGQMIGASAVGRVLEMAAARLGQLGRREMNKKVSVNTILFGECSNRSLPLWHMS